MANKTTSLTEVTPLNPFYAYVVDMSTKTNRVVGSPAIMADPILNGLLAQGGQTKVEIRDRTHLNNQTVNENISTDDTDDVSPNITKLGTRIHYAPILERNTIYSSADIVEEMADIALMQGAASEAAGVVVEKRNDSLISTLTGVTAKLASTHQNSIFTEDGDNATAANKISDGAIIETCAPWGDQSMPGLMAMHSDVYRDLQELDLIDFQRSSTADIGFGTYLQWGVYVDDKCPKRAGTSSGYVYEVFFLRPGAVGYATRMPKNPVAIQREELEANGGGAEYLIVRDSYSWWPKGMSFTGTPSGTTVSNAELATDTNWTLVKLGKQVGIASLLVNV